MVEVISPALLCAAAGDARAHARRVRAQSAERRIEAELAVAAFARTPQPHVRSAWSDLEWRYPGGELDNVLVSHDGET